MNIFSRYITSFLLVTLVFLAFIFPDPTYGARLLPNTLELGTTNSDFITITDKLPDTLEGLGIFPTEQDLGRNNEDYVTVFLPGTNKDVQQMGFGVIDIDVSFGKVVTGQFLGPEEGLVSLSGRGPFMGIKRIRDRDGNGNDGLANVFSRVKLMKNPSGPSLLIYDIMSTKAEINAYNSVDPMSFQPNWPGILGVQYEGGNIIIDNDGKDIYNNDIKDSKIDSVGTVTLGGTAGGNAALNIMGDLEFDQFFGGEDGRTGTTFISTKSNGDIIELTALDGNEPTENWQSTNFEMDLSGDLRGMTIVAILTASVIVDDDARDINDDPIIQLRLDLRNGSDDTEELVTTGNITAFDFEGSTAEDCVDFNGCSPKGNFMTILTYEVSDSSRDYWLSFSYRFKSPAGVHFSKLKSGKISKDGLTISVLALKASLDVQR